MDQSGQNMPPPRGLCISTTEENSQLAPLDGTKLKFTPTTTPRNVPDVGSPEVAAMSVCTDHMIVATWTATHGWGTPEAKPYSPLSIMPTASVLQYATECFEGLKVYRGLDGKLRLFRPGENCKRMLTSSQRITLPDFDPEQLELLIKALVSIDGEKWLPSCDQEAFLYLRPTHIGTGPALGPKRPTASTLYVIACLFPRRISLRDPHVRSENKGSVESDGLRLLASPEDTVRAWPGGFGNVKLGANYGPSFIMQEKATKAGFDQVLWLVDEDCKVTEAGLSNFFIVWRTEQGTTELVTPSLEGGVILPGITRKSVLELARTRLSRSEIDGCVAVEIVEKTIPMAEVTNAVQSGRIIEAFVTGTAMFISPVRLIHYRGVDLYFPVAGHFAQQLRSWLADIMWGRVSHEWAVVIDEKAY